MLKILLKLVPPDGTVVSISLLVGIIGAALLLFHYARYPDAIFHRPWVAFGGLVVSLSLATVMNSVLVHSPPSSLPELQSVVGGLWMHEIARETLQQVSGDMAELMSRAGGWQRPENVWPSSSIVVAQLSLGFLLSVVVAFSGYLLCRLWPYVKKVREVFDGFK